MRIFSPSFVLNGSHQSIFLWRCHSDENFVEKSTLYSCTYSPKSNTYIPFFPGQSSTLSRSHSIASAGDKSLILSTVSSPNTTMHHPGRHVSDVSNERLLHELQMSKKQQACVLLLLFFKMQIWRKNKIKELFFREMKIISFYLTEKVKKEMFFREIVI